MRKIVKVTPKFSYIDDATTQRAWQELENYDSLSDKISDLTAEVFELERKKSESKDKIAAIKTNFDIEYERKVYTEIKNDCNMSIVNRSDARNL